MENLSLSFANALAPLVKVNAVAPALLLFNTQDTAAYRTKALDKSLIPREGGIQEFLNAIDFLLNSNYITGQVIHLDGGRHLK
jgi:dihydromonapterin reductase/dihydrofolate reductase